MVDVAPNTALMIALGNAYNNARANAPRGNPTASIPGLGGAGAVEGIGATPGVVAGSGVPGGSVPGTATTGDAVMDAILGGGAGGSDPVAQQVAEAGLRLGLGGSGPGERGDRGAGVSGGDLRTFASILGGPTAIPSILANVVGNDVFGFDPSTSGLINNLLALEESEAGASGFGVNATGGEPFSFDPGANVGAGNLPAAGGPFSDPVDFSVPSPSFSFGGGGSGRGGRRSPEARARDRNEQPR